MASCHHDLAPVATLAHGDVADRLVADAPIDDVAPDEHLARLRLERVEVDVPAAQANAVAVDPGEPAGVDEDAAALAGGDETEHSRRHTGAAGDDDDVVEPTDRRTAGIEQRQAHDSERVDQIACHVARLPPRACSGRMGCCGQWALISTNVS